MESDIEKHGKNILQGDPNIMCHQNYVFQMCALACLFTHGMLN